MGTHNYDMIKDLVTGKEVPDVGAEANRQEVEKVLLEEKGYASGDIAVDYPVKFTVNTLEYETALDLVVSVDSKPVMAIKCAAGSLNSREREIVSGARVSFEAPIPLAVVSDGKDWLVFDTQSGNLKGEGRESVPGVDEARTIAAAWDSTPLDPKKLAKERLIFRSYDMDNVNIGRKA